MVAGCVSRRVRYRCRHCWLLDVPSDLEKLPNMVGGVRPKEIPINDYYDESTRQIVERIFDFELETFDYQFPD